MYLICLCNITQTTIQSSLIHVAVKLLLCCNEIHLQLREENQLTVSHQEFPQAHWSRGQVYVHVGEARNQAVNKKRLYWSSHKEIINPSKNTQQF
jgi:hypothetical protein